MDIESFRTFCLALPGVEETLPFGPDTLVYKVMGKAFALTGLDSEQFDVNLKCDPERAIELREEYPGQIIPGWHMNKKHWNTVTFDSGLSNALLTELMMHSYNLVVAGLPAKTRSALCANE
jgi:predicted DNA-binding protein (MmcQ/YjbR family)